MERGDVDAGNESDRRFHATIVQFSGNATPIAVLDDLNHRVQMIRSLSKQNPAVVIRIGLQRPQILAALGAGDADAAARLLGEHIEFGRQTVVAEQEATASVIAARGQTRLGSDSEAGWRCATCGRNPGMGAEG